MQRRNLENFGWASALRRWQQALAASEDDGFKLMIIGGQSINATAAFFTIHTATDPKDKTNIDLQFACLLNLKIALPIFHVY